MREYIVYIWIGVWLLLLPLLGIPGDWKETLLIATALGVIAYSYIGYRKITRAGTINNNSGAVTAGDAAADNQSTPS